jgi:hypothetical protein
MVRYVDKYDFSAVVETSLSRDHLDVSGIKCAAGYSGVVTVSACISEGEPYIVSGCVKLCKRPTNIVGYNFDDVTESSLKITQFHVTGITCAAGYSGSVSVSNCVDRHWCAGANGCSAEYLITGCQLDPNKVCVRPTKLLQRQGYNIIEYDTTKSNFNVIVNGCLEGYETRNGISPHVTLCDNIDGVFSSYGLHGCYIKNVKRYKLVSSGSCGMGNLVMNKNDCEAAITYLGLNNEYGYSVFHAYNGYNNGYYTPCASCVPGCFISKKYKRIYLNFNKMSDLSCGSDNSPCVCKDPSVPHAPNVYSVATAPQVTTKLQTEICKSLKTEKKIPQSIPTGYDFSNVIEQDLSGTSDFSVTGLKCALGFSGTPHAVKCTQDNTPYTVVGCVTNPTTKAPQVVVTTTATTIETTINLPVTTKVPTETAESPHITTLPVTMPITSDIPSTTTPTPVIEKNVVEQKIEFRGATKEEIEDNKKHVEKALAKSLGVQADKVKIIDIIEVQKGNRRYLLGSTFVEIIYEVEVEDLTEAKEVESNMEAKEFKSTLDHNIKTESPNLTITVENVKRPKTHGRIEVAPNDEGGGDYAVTSNMEDNNKDTSPNPFGGELVVIVLCCTCVVCGCAGIYYYKYNLRPKDDPNAYIRLSNIDSKNARTIKNRNSWNMNASELKARNEPPNKIKKK